MSKINGKNTSDLVDANNFENAKEYLEDLHYQKTRFRILAAISEMENMATSQDSENLAIDLVSILIYAGSQNVDKIFLDIKNHVSKRGFSLLIGALGFIPLGNSNTAILNLLENLAKDEDTHIKEAAIDSLDMIKFALS